MRLSQNQLMFFWDGRYPNVSYLGADAKDPHPALSQREREF